ncbi:hypothetical protein [Sicyoidochytrium minutum DNA virus]|nr:hypothetical protein [Sicyoidochytrium minutum DNA virus]
MVKQKKLVPTRQKKDDNVSKVGNGALIGLLVASLIFFLGAVGWFVYVMIRNNSGGNVPGGISATNPKTCPVYYAGACLYIDKQPCFINGLSEATGADPLTASAEMIEEMNKYIPSQAFLENGKPEVGLPFLVLFDNTIANLSVDNFMRIIGAGYNTYDSVRDQVYGVGLSSTQFGAISMFQTTEKFDTDAEMFRFCENPNPGCPPDQQTASLVVPAEIANQLPDDTAENRCKNASMQIE